MIAPSHFQPTSAPYPRPGTTQPHLAASIGTACTSGIPEPSHVLRALGLTPAQSDASIRFSFGRFTTDDEIEQATRLVIDCLKTI